MRALEILILALITPSRALYPTSSNVVDLNPTNFNELVINGNEIWMVEFFAPWCGHCQQLVPEYQKAAKALNDIIKVGAVNVDEHKELGTRYNIKSFPTIKIFGVNKNKPEIYNGGRTAQGLADAALLAVRTKVYAKIGLKSPKQDDSTDVIELTDDNFDRLVLNSEEMWLVEFYAPWCGHCKNLAPHWSEAATKLKGKVKLGALDTTMNQMKTKEYNIDGFPTIKYFGPGKKKYNSVETYEGGRTASDIVTWAMEKLTENIPDPELLQIIGQESFKDACLGKPLCVISVLPYILDCQSKCRYEYLDLLKETAKAFKKKMWGWMWMEAAAQRELENSFDIGGFGYPAMAVVNVNKMKYSMFKGSFSKAGINEYLRDLSYGRGNSATVKAGQLPQIVDTIAWDGKDGEFPVEDDIDLSDVVLEEKDEL